MRRPHWDEWTTSQEEVEQLAAFASACQVAIGALALGDPVAAASQAWEVWPAAVRSLPARLVRDYVALRLTMAIATSCGMLPRSVAGMFGAREAARSSEDPRVSTFVCSLQDRIGMERVLQPRVARQVGISQRQLRRLLKRNTGKGFLEQLVIARIGLASRMLTETPLTVKEVAAKCGYAHTSSLDRQFRRLMGCRPLDWRQRHTRDESSDK